MEIISASKVNTKLVLSNKEVIMSLEERMRSNSKPWEHGKGYVSPMYDRPIKAEPMTIILDTKSIIDNHKTELEMLGCYIEVFDIIEVITQALQRLLVAGEKQSAHEVCQYLDYSRLVNSDITAGNPIGLGIIQSFEKMVSELIMKLEEHGMNQGQDFNYVFDRFLGDDVVLRKLTS